MIFGCLFFGFYKNNLLFSLRGNKSLCINKIKSEYLECLHKKTMAKIKLKSEAKFKKKSILLEFFMKREIDSKRL